MFAYVVAWLPCNLHNHHLSVQQYLKSFLRVQWRENQTLAERICVLEFKNLEQRVLELVRLPRLAELILACLL
jgi:hypothetical protein